MKETVVVVVVCSVKRTSYCFWDSNRREQAIPYIYKRCLGHQPYAYNRKRCRDIGLKARYTMTFLEAQDIMRLGV